MTAETWTATATVIIALFTIILAVSGSVQAWLTRNAIRLTSDSIKLARDEFNATHRPRLSVRRMKPQPYDAPVRVQYAIVNVGTTTATITRHEIRLCIQTVDGDEHIQTIPLECPQLKGGESRLFWTKNIDDEFAYCWGLASESTVVKIQGVVEYEDGTRTTRRTGFLRTYDGELGRFRVSGDPEEEYED